MFKTKVTMLVCVLAALVVLSGEAGAAVPPIDLSGSVWELTGSLKANIPKVGRVKQSGPVDLFFGLNAVEGLGAGEFLMVDPEGDEIYGTHTSSSKSGEELTPNAASLENYIAAKIQSAAAGASVTAVVNDIEVTSVKASAKPKSVSTGISLSLNVTVKATVDLTVDGQPVVSKVSVTLKGKGLIEMTGAGTYWFIPTISKYSIKGLGRITDVGTLYLLLGPDDGEGLADYEFAAVDDEARGFTGTYTVMKGKVTVNPNEIELEDFLIEVIEDEVDGASNVNVDITKTTITAKIKHGVSNKLTIMVKFNAQGEIYGEPASGKGSFLQKGTGTPVGSLFASYMYAGDVYVDAINGII